MLKGICTKLTMPGTSHDSFVPDLAKNDSENDTNKVTATDQAKQRGSTVRLAVCRHTVRASNTILQKMLACMTATWFPAMSEIGQHNIFLVRNPVFLSMAGLNNPQAYASGMLRLVPDSATLPAMPVPKGTLIISQCSSGFATRALHRTHLSMNAVLSTDEMMHLLHTGQTARLIWEHI